MSVENIRELRCDRCGVAVTLRSHEETPAPWGQLTVLRGFRGDQSDDLCTDCVDSLKLWFTTSDPVVVPDDLDMSLLSGEWPEAIVVAPHFALSPTQKQRRDAIGVVAAQLRCQVGDVLALARTVNLITDADQPFPLSNEGIEERAELAVDTMLMLFEGAST